MTRTTSGTPATSHRPPRAAAPRLATHDTLPQRPETDVELEP